MPHNTPTTWIISDCHLCENRPRINEIFLHFLKKDVQANDTLYILGDFFEVWVGDDDMTPFHQSIIKALKEKSNSGTQLFFMHGNRDFLIGKTFCQQTGCQLLKDPTLITLAQTKTLLTHGDSLCLDDKQYQLFRKFTRNKLIKFLYLSLPLTLRKKIANNLRQKSQSENALKPQNIMDVTPTAVNHLLKKHNCPQLIHGHTHRPGVHQHNFGKRYVLGAWEHEGFTYRILEDAPIEALCLENSEHKPEYP